MAKADLPFLRHARYYLQVLGEIEDRRRLGGDNVDTAAEKFDESRLQIEQAFDRASQRYDRSTEFAELCVAYPEIGRAIMWFRFAPREFLHWLDVASQAADRLNNQEKLAWHQAIMSATYLQTGQIDAAIAAARRALAVVGDEAETWTAGMALAGLGEAFAMRDEFQSSIPYFERAIDIFRQLDKKDSLGITWQNLGSARAGLGNWEEAKTCYQKADKIQKATGNVLHEAHLWRKRALMEIAQGDCEAAKPLLEKAFVLFHDVDDATGKAEVCCSFGDLAWKRGNLNEAKARYEQSLAICQRIGNLFFQGLASLGLARVEMHLGNKDHAYEHAKNAERLFLAIGNKEKAAATREFDQV